MSSLARLLLTLSLLLSSWYHIVNGSRIKLTRESRILRTPIFVDPIDPPPKAAHQQPISQQQNDYEIISYLVQHFLELELGTPPTSFHAKFDFSWSNMFVPAVECTQLNGDCARLNKYNSTASSTFIANGTHTKIWQCCRVDIEGPVSEDVLRIGGLDILQQFTEGKSWKEDYDPHWARTESAFGFSRLSPLGPPYGMPVSLTLKSPLQNMVEQGVLERNVFAMKFPWMDEDEGELLLGEVDPEYQDELVTLPISTLPNRDKEEDQEYPSGFEILRSIGWEVPISGLTLGANNTNAPPLTFNLSGYTAFVSNTFEWIDMPDDMYFQVAEHLGAPTFYEHGMSCDLRNTWPDMTLTFGDRGNITLSPREYIPEVLDNWPSTCLVPFGHLLHTPWDDDKPRFIVLGIPFLQKVYSEFDLDDDTISCKCLLTFDS
jgi:hypothetical protein